MSGPHCYIVAAGEMADAFDTVAGSFLIMFAAMWFATSFWRIADRWRVHCRRRRLWRIRCIRQDARNGVRP